MSIPQEVITAQVQAAVASVLMERGDDFIREMVKQAIEEPARDPHGRVLESGYGGKRMVKTRFGLLLETMIQKAAAEAAEAWLEEQKDEIKKAVRAYLGRTKKAVITKMADQIIDGLSKPNVYLRMTFGDDS